MKTRRLPVAGEEIDLLAVAAVAQSVQTGAIPAVV